MKPENGTYLVSLGKSLLKSAKRVRQVSVWKKLGSTHVSYERSAASTLKLMSMTFMLNVYLGVVVYTLNTDFKVRCSLRPLKSLFEIPALLK